MSDLCCSGSMEVVLSCEHGGNMVPPQYKQLFKDAKNDLYSHRGWDPGALDLFKIICHKGIYYGLYEETTRLLIDLNRSLNRRTLFSKYSDLLTLEEKQKIINRYYLPFREQFYKSILRLLGQKRFVFHLSVHSFTPVLGGVTRDADLGLLYDPGYGIEKKIAYEWRRIINREIPGLRVRMNYPYQGKPDGHVAALRKSLDAEVYAGIELEMNQKYAENIEIMKQLADTFYHLLNAI